MISKQAVLDVLKEMEADFKRYGDYLEKSAISDAISKINALPVISDGWIRCEDGLPEVGTKVLVYFGHIDNQLMAITGIDKNGNKVFGVFYTDTFSYEHTEYITHWQPLPSPPTK